MRHLAAELGVEPMSLYHHIAHREALLDGVGALIVEQLSGFHEGLTGTWKEQVGAAAHRFRAGLLAHPNAVVIIATRSSTTGYLSDLAAGTLEFFEDLGLSPTVAEDLLWLLNAYVIGDILNLLPEDGQPAPDTGDSSFARGLAIILEGLDVADGTSERT